MAKRLVPGSYVRVGFNVSGVLYGLDESTGNTFPFLVDDMTGCLYDSGLFENVDVNFKPGGFLSSDYFQVDAVTAEEFTDYEDFGSFVQQTLGLCAPTVRVKDRYPVVIDREPEATKNDPTVAHVNATDQSRPNIQRDPSVAGKCSQYSGFDYVGCELGIQTGTAKLGTGLLAVGGLLVLVLILKR